MESFLVVVVSFVLVYIHHNTVLLCGVFVVTVNSIKLFSINFLTFHVISDDAGVQFSL